MRKITKIVLTSMRQLEVYCKDVQLTRVQNHISPLYSHVPDDTLVALYDSAPDVILFKTYTNHTLEINKQELFYLLGYGHWFEERYNAEV